MILRLQYIKMRNYYYCPIVFCLISGFLYVIYYTNFIFEPMEMWSRPVIRATHLLTEKPADFSSLEVIVPEIIQPTSKEVTRRVAMTVQNKNLYTRVTKTFEKRIIHLSTRYHDHDYTKDFFFLQAGSESFERYQCPVRDCYVTYDESDIPADALLFHMRDTTTAQLAKGLGKKATGRDLNQKWILYTMEPPWLDYLDLSRMDNIFNWTMSYRLDSDIPLRYGFVGKRTNFRESFESNYLNKTKLAVWMVSDCCTSSKREEYVREMRRHSKVDVYGTCGEEFCRPAESPLCYKKLSRYFFYLAFENAICKDYVTEKFFNILETQLVPVVFGGVNYKKFAPQNSYINALDFESPKHLVEYLELVTKNRTLYEQFFQWKKKAQVYLQAWTCDLCAKLHSEDFYKKSTKVRLHEWWHKYANCKSWTLNGLVDEMYPTIPCYLKGIFKND